GGTARAVAGWSGALAAQGVVCHHLSLAAPAGDTEVLPPAAAGGRLHRLPAFWWGGRPMARPLGVGRAAARLLREQAIDVVHVHGLWSPAMHAVCAAARAQGVPLVVSPHGMLTPWALRQHAWKKRLAWRLYQHRDLRSAAVLHATADTEAAELRGLGLRNPLAVVANAVDLPPWREPVPGRPPRTVLFLSRIHPKKGLLRLVEAWARLRPASWRCVVAGPDEGGHLAEVRRAVQAAGLDADFSFPGPVDDAAKWDLYRSASLVVLPTHSENFGLVVAEALACGVPVITTRGAPWRELAERQCGWWIDPGTEPLAAALREAMALTDGQRWEMGRRGRLLVEERYSWTRAAAEMAQVYDWCVKRGPPPPALAAAGRENRPPGRPPEIAVLMATCNGARFVGEQIESVFRQSDDGWRLWIRDDASTDGTPVLLAAIAERQPQRIRLVTDAAGRLGACQNFHRLLQVAEGDYFMFCDQDDVWRPDKVAVMMQKMRELENAHPGLPLLVFSDAVVVDEALAVLAESFWQRTRLDPRQARNLNRVLFGNVVAGCCTLFNRAAREAVLPIAPEAVMHDWWLAIEVAGRGMVDFVPQATTLYRQHPANLVGARSVGTAYFFGQLRRLWAVLRNYAVMYRLARRRGLPVSLWAATGWKIGSLAGRFLAPAGWSRPQNRGGA
ncbi:MAG: glycosyltransferase, partial [Lentisphaeria bacterium]